MDIKKEKIKTKNTPAKKAVKKVVRATLKQRKAIKILAENGRKSVSQAMREAGYSNSSATKPSKLTRSKGWQELMDEYFPPDYVAEKHKELFEAEDTVFIPRGKKIIEKKRPDFRARKAALDMAHKLRGNYAPEKIELSKRKFQDMSDKELRETIAEAKKTLLKK